jgi:glycosyltransferase involved in cell wall biosynthesis
LRVGVDARHLAGGRGVAHYTSELLTALADGFPADQWRALVPGKGPLVWDEPSGAGGSGTARRGATGSGPGGSGPAGSGSNPIGSGSSPIGSGSGVVGSRSGVVGSGSGTGGRASGGVDVVRHSLPSRALFGSAALFGRPRLDRLVGGEPDVLWIPAPAPVAVSDDVPYVLTVHDLSWLERPGDFTAYERLWHRLGRFERLAEHARVVVAVSQATRAAIAEHWPRVEDVRVVHSGIPALPPPAPRPPWLPDRYVLAVGALEPRKAPLLLKQAFEDARSRGLQADLVFAGRGRLAGRLQGEGVHVVEDADRATLATLYEHALALALPSHVEGFGFTALEAARAGVPVLASDLPTIRETLGEAAKKVEGSWSDALLEIARDARKRERMAEQGRAAARRFDWNETAQQMHAVLTEAAK